jgi:hypothetical protein
MSKEEQERQTTIAELRKLQLEQLKTQRELTNLIEVSYREALNHFIRQWRRGK